MIGKLESFEVVSPLVAKLVWDDGLCLTFDFTHVIASNSVLAPLASEAEFSQARLSGDHWSVEWPCGIDFGAQQLRQWALSRSQIQPAA
jgi:hypothetical protein